MVHISKAIINNKRYKNQEDYCRDISLEKIKEQIKESLKKDIFQSQERKIVLSFSGGTDSTLLLCLAKDLGIKNILPVIITYEKSQDLYFSERIAKHLHQDHKIIILNKNDLLLNNKEMSKIKLNSKWKGYFITYTLLKIMSKYSKTIIMGNGMDELGGGFDYHMDPVKIKNSKSGT